MNLRTWLCSLTGHDMLRHRQGTQLVLRCVDCGHTRPGWSGWTRKPVRQARKARRKVATAA